ncbi:MAG: transcription-repair coupling factor [Phycisphaerae bacterium]|nr:transcription-repair coupling factor [Phycisphaerae bacterium]
MLTSIVEDQRLREIASLFDRATRVAIEGIWGSSAPFAAAAVAKLTGKRLLYVTAHLDQADDVQEDLELFTGQPVDVFPGWEADLPENLASDEIAAERLNVLTRLRLDPDQVRIVVAPVQALVFPVPQPGSFIHESFELKHGGTLDVEAFAQWLVDHGYTRLDRVEQPGDFAIRGGIADVYPSGVGHPVRVELFGDQIDSIRRFDPATQRSTDAMDYFYLPATSDYLLKLPGCPVFDYFLDTDTIICWHEPVEVSELAQTFVSRLKDPVGVYPFHAISRQTQRFNQLALIRFPGELFPHRARIEFAALPRFEAKPDAAVAQVIELAAEYDTTVFCENQAEIERFSQLLASADPHAAQRITLRVGLLHRGFLWPDRKLALVGHHEIFHRYEHRHRLKRSPVAAVTEAYGELETGDYVVHVQHGIGKYEGLKVVRRGDRSEEVLVIKYAGNVSLQVPVWQADQVQKYIGAFRGHPQLSQLGGKTWQKTKEKVGEAVSSLAAEMLEIQARREATGGIAYPPDTDWQRQLEESFIYQETEDQLLAIRDIKQDMQRPRAMDRLLCGDVGYGKTEIAMRAAFKALEAGYQVAVLVPTTILAEQHYRTFSERLAEFPFTVESISRFKSRKQQKDVLQRTVVGRVDVLIGTHRLLSKDVRFANLGMVVVDEEQRFGVAHKERLKQLRATVDVLTLTATPIPRTLHMSLIGLRDISTLATPPLDRRSIQTEIRKLDWALVRQAILREMNRDGQVYFVHNYVKDIQQIAEHVQAAVPEARIVIGHGQMDEKELEKVMLAFLRRQADVLVCTTIIESGVDIPTVNTIIINNADRFGLADLHQLRGRVGRYKYRAHAYLMLPPKRPLTPIAERRLRAIEEYSELGAGFRIAMRDLEIRGAGNILGPEQSGHIAAVGYELYCQLLAETVDRLQDRPAETHRKANLDLPLVGALPKKYVASERDRLQIYQRLAGAERVDDVDQLERDLNDIHGRLPDPTRMLLDLARLRLVAGRWGVRTAVLRDEDLVFHLDDATRCQELFSRSQIPPRFADPREVHLRLPPRYREPATLVRILFKLFSPAHEPQTAT